MRFLLILAGSALLLAGLALGGAWYYSCRIAEPEWVTGVADCGAIRKIVSSTGTLKAVNVVEIGCQISGIIASLPADFNDEVQPGQVLALLDPTIFEAQVLQAEADLEGCIAQERNLHAKLISLKGNIATVEARGHQLCLLMLCGIHPWRHRSQQLRKWLSGGHTARHKK